MPRKFKPQIVTANDLLEGDVIYMTETGMWCRDHAQAWVAQDIDTAKARLAEAEAQSDSIVGPYLANVDFDAEGRPVPDHFREAFRTRGPSNYFHGKQAEGAEHV